mmetsp:Transcript_25118/g.63144  ORF Transcript_25118/g.63144 Transcript_25118/m.63144 type:complete len:173 (-) Transcript_25118:54-572(-)|eukprot:CAMPEP_0177645954 /NCGR_PEP_ID=MMETSP0447-20121125/9521_1 /TAXON_ID=0 /ORGANISM="Stygamoeba regulata, Strain BSH-02190019" /LENGTH=172 /DNA_ID=CAMNT_0019148465 /DNA_START=66 /DNA_END=584 /DNA_ORIENTATION=+
MEQRIEHLQASVGLQGAGEPSSSRTLSSDVETLQKQLTALVAGQNALALVTTPPVFRFFEEASSLKELATKATEIETNEKRLRQMASQLELIRRLRHSALDHDSDSLAQFEQLEIRLATLKEQLVCCGHEVEKSHDEFVRLLSVYNEMVAQLSLAFLRWNKVLDVRLAGNAE